MTDYYIATVKYGDIDQTTGKEVVLSEQYLLDSVSFADAEERIYGEIVSRTNGDFDVSGIKRVKLSEIIFDPKSVKDTWYKAKVQFFESDEKTGKIKKVNHGVLVNSQNIKTAISDIIDRMCDVVEPWAIVSIADTELIEVFISENVTNEQV